VVLPGGTTTVVFSGGGGLELLMQPASNPAAAIALSNAFIVDSCASQRLGFAESILGNKATFEAGADHLYRCRSASYEPATDSYSV
jgi:hypothetical protein